MHQTVIAFALNSLLSNNSSKCMLQMLLQAELRFSPPKEGEDEFGGVELGN